MKCFSHENANKVVKTISNLPVKNLYNDYALSDCHNFIFRQVERVNIDSQGRPTGHTLKDFLMNPQNCPPYPSLQ